MSTLYGREGEGGGGGDRERRDGAEPPVKVDRLVDSLRGAGGVRRPPARKGRDVSTLYGREGGVRRRAGGTCLVRRQGRGAVLVRGRRAGCGCGGALACTAGAPWSHTLLKKEAFSPPRSSSAGEAV